MELLDYNLTSLFEQLGLDTAGEAMQAFVEQHHPLPGHVALEDAEFWNGSQSTFLKEAISEDSAWAEAADELNSLLRD
jgi:hypothetical protein